MTQDPPVPDATEFYYVIEGERLGPVVWAELVRLVEAGEIQTDDLVWTSAMADWARAGSLDGLFDSVSATPPVPPTSSGPPATPPATPVATGAAGAHPPMPSPRHPPISAGPVDGRAGGAGMGAGAAAMEPPPYTPESIGRLYAWWLGLYISGMVLSIVLIGIPLLIVGIVLWCMLIYRAWRVIQDGHARTPPGKAVGFMFIPFYNLYWIFVAVNGLAVDTNRYIERHGLNVPRRNEGVALWYCIMVPATIVPYIGLLALIPLIVLMFMFVHDMQRTTRAILVETGGV